MAKKPTKKDKSNLSIEVKDLKPANNPKGGVTATSGNEPGTLKATDSTSVKYDPIANTSVKLR
ncbi:MAG: hypothetical protein ABI718_04985 [Acidobacteriota bacterium]